METDIGKNVSKLRSSKAAEDSNIPTKIGKHNFYFFAESFYFTKLLDLWRHVIFHLLWKWQTSHLYIKRQPVRENQLSVSEYF